MEELNLIPNYLSLTFYSEELILTFLTIRKSSRLSLRFSVQLSSVTQLCPTLCNPMDYRTPRLPCPSPTPRAYSNSCPSHRWCHSAILSSVVPFSCLQSFPASGSFPMRQFFASGSQSFGVSALALVLLMNINIVIYYSIVIFTWLCSIVIFHNIVSSNKRTWYVFPSVAVIFLSMSFRFPGIDFSLS